MTALQAWSLPVGIGLGLGLWTLVSLLPRVGAPRLAGRVAPYVIDLWPEALAALRRPPSEPASVLAGLAAPVSQRIARGLSLMRGGDERIAALLRQAGSAASVESFRSRQLLSVLFGVAGGCVVATISSQTTTAPALLLGAVVAFGAAGGAMFPEQLLARSARFRQARIAAELPTVLEFLTLSLTAGESILDALRRVARTGTGELSREFASVVADVNSGVPLSVGLARCSKALALPSFARLVDQLVGALERGSPLAEVLRAHAQDSREDAKGRLLEAAGRKEVAMLVPLVFLILPVTIAFAIFPGILVLQLGQ